MRPRPAIQDDEPIYSARELYEIIKAVKDGREAGSRRGDRSAISYFQSDELVDGAADYLRCMAAEPWHARHCARAFYDIALECWFNSVGSWRLSHSAPPGRSIPTGPLVRYMEAVTKPIMRWRAPRAEAIAQLIKARRRLDREQGAFEKLDEP